MPITTTIKSIQDIMRKDVGVISRPWHLRSHHMEIPHYGAITYTKPRAALLSAPSFGMTMHVGYKRGGAGAKRQRLPFVFIQDPVISNGDALNSFLNKLAITSRRSEKSPCYILADLPAPGSARGKSVATTGKFRISLPPRSGPSGMTL